MARAKKSKDTQILEPFAWEGLAPQPLIGVDEVGRGCLAGRVYAAAVIVDLSKPIEGITDSKLLSESRREELCQLIRERWQVGLGFASVEEIDRLNILHAALLAMKRAVAELPVLAGHVLVDGNQRVPGLPSGFEQTTVIKGDLRCLPIAAASVVAKVARDTYMAELASEFPFYGFEKHKGYGTVDHRGAIQKHGPCPQHRSSFAGVREFLPTRPQPL